MEDKFYEYYTDEDGYWGKYENGISVLLEPSEEYLKKHPIVDIEEEIPLSVYDELALAYKEGVNGI